MSPELYQLRDELVKRNTYETSILRGCIADLIKNKADRNLLNICLNAGILQDFFQEITNNTFFIDQCKSRLIEECFINEIWAKRAISYCKFLTGKHFPVQIDNKSNSIAEHYSESLARRTPNSKMNYRNFDKKVLLWIIIRCDCQFIDIDQIETSDGLYFVLYYVLPGLETIRRSIRFYGDAAAERFEFWECTANCSFEEKGRQFKIGTKVVLCYSISDYSTW